MTELKIEYLPLDSIEPYENNARHHEEYDVESIKESIKEFGMNDPIGVWSDSTHTNVIVEGHGRLLAVKELAKEFPDDETYKTVPVIHLDQLSNEQRRAYGLAHNKTAELSSWDYDILGKELKDIVNIDMSQFGFTEEDVENAGSETVEDDKYTFKVKIPQYEITGDCPTLDQLVDTSKTNELINVINGSDVTEEEKEFLRKAAQRHMIFNYRNIAEYYAHATAEMQKLMEDSALVIIDVNDAIADGYAELNSDVLDAIKESEDEE